MKNKISKSIVGLIIAIGIGLVSCTDDFTNLTPKGSTSYGNFWQTAQDAEEAANSMYYYMRDEDMFSRGFFWYINASDDMVTGRIRAESDNTKNFNLTGDEGGLKWMYVQSYKVIRRANDILLNVPDMDITQSLKDRVLGEAYFMRAFHYHWIAYHYGDDGENGGVPIVTVENMFDAAG